MRMLANKRNLNTKRNLKICFFSPFSLPFKYFNLCFSQSAHIQNALYFDTMHCVKPNEWYPRNIRKYFGGRSLFLIKSRFTISFDFQAIKECFQDYVGSMGISNKHHLIVYDRSPFGFYAASRVYWIFRVGFSFLNFLMIFFK